MQITLEKPVNAVQACAALGIGGTMMSALKRAMGIKSRYFFLSDVRQFMRKNPGFTVSKIYPRNRTPHASNPTMKASPPTHRDNHSQKSDAVPQEPSASILAEACVPRIEPKPEGALDHSSRSGSQPWRTARFLQKWKAERGNISRCAIGDRSGLSSETIRRFERGLSVKPSTFKRIAKAWGIQGRDWNELLICRFKDEFGDDAHMLAIEKSIDNGYPPKSKDSREAAELFDQLTPSEQMIICRTMIQREVIACLPAILNLKPTAAADSPATKFEAVQVRYRSKCTRAGKPLRCSANVNDLWRSL